MGPETRGKYEEAVKRGLFRDPYAERRLHNEAHPDAINGFAASFQRSVPFLSESGAGLAAGVHTANDALHGRPTDFGENWRAYRDFQQADVDQYKEGHPILANQAGTLGLAAQIAPAFFTGGATAAPAIESTLAATAPKVAGLAGAVTRAVPKIIRNATIGEAYGAVNGAARPGTVEERAATAAEGGGLGALIGGAFPAAVGVGAKALGATKNALRPFGAVVSEVKDAATRAITGETAAGQAAALPPRAVAQGQQQGRDFLASIGATPERLREAALKANGKPITAAEAIGPQGVSHATGIARRAGTTPEVADATMSARADQRGSRVLADLESVTGLSPEAAQGGVEALVAKGRARAAPLYDAAYGMHPPQSDALDSILTRPSTKEALNRAAKIAAEEGRDPLTLGFVVDEAGSVQSVRAPTVQTLDYVKRGLDDVLEAYRDSTTGRLRLDERGRAINGTRVEFRNLITNDASEAGAAYKAALAESGDYLSAEQAYRRGRGNLLARNIDPRRFDTEFKAMTPSQQDASRAAALNDLYTGTLNGSLKPGAFRPPAVKMKLATLFGDDAADQLIVRFRQEADMAAAEARMRPNMNSVTGDVIGADADLAGAGVGIVKGIGNAARGRPGAAARDFGSVVAPFVSAARAPYGQATRNAIGEGLYSTPDELAAVMQEHLKRRGPPPTIAGLSFGDVVGRIGAEQAGANQ